MLGRSVTLFVTLLAAAGFVARQNRPEPAPVRATFDRFPAQIQRWTGRQLPPMEDRILAILGADDYLNRVYVSPERAGVALFVGYYNSQRQGDSIHSPMNCLPGAGWEPLSKSFVKIPVTVAGETKAIDANRYVIQKGLDRQIVLYWYQSHGRTVASEYWSKFYLIRDAVRLNRTDGAIVRIIAPIAGSSAEAEQQAEATATRFVGALLPRLSTVLPD
jgi:EpsI family protein